MQRKNDSAKVCLQKDSMAAEKLWRCIFVLDILTTEVLCSLDNVNGPALMRKRDEVTGFVCISWPGQQDTDMLQIAQTLEILSALLAAVAHWGVLHLVHADVGFVLGCGLTCARACSGSCEL